MEDVDIGLEETVVETSPDFDESPQEPPTMKAGQWKNAAMGMSDKGSAQSAIVSNSSLLPAYHPFEVTVSHANLLIKRIRFII